MDSELLPQRLNKHRENQDHLSEIIIFETNSRLETSVEDCKAYVGVMETCDNEDRF